MNILRNIGLLLLLPFLLLVAAQQFILFFLLDSVRLEDPNDQWTITDFFYDRFF